MITENLENANTTPQHHGTQSIRRLRGQVGEQKSGTRESRCPVKRMGPQGSLLAHEQTSRGHCKKGFKEWGGENRRIKGSLLEGEGPKRDTEKQPKLVSKVLFHDPPPL